ncbi:MAG: transporter, partial [Gemmatimonadaceae bacterium]
LQLRAVAVALPLILLAAPLQAQGLRTKLSSLFIFGSGQDPLFLGGSAGPNSPPGVQVHGNHFVPAVVEDNAAIISFITNSISGSVANVPISATSSGSTFRFEGGVPVRTSVSAGPVFGERAQTLGRGRALVGVNRTGISFKTLRGVDLSNIRLTFTHSNVDFPNCDQIFGGDCSRMGVPAFENEVMNFHLDLDIDLAVTSFYLTYGVSDRLDVGVVVPIVETSLRGRSLAQIVPFGEEDADHFFGGDTEDPVLSAERFEEGSATGIGDVAVRVKLNLRDEGTIGLALLGDARFATGSEEDLLGSGAFAARGLAIMSARFGAFSPHANVGYLYHDSPLMTDAVLATVGFDHLMAPWATLAVDLVSELQVGSSVLRVPGPVAIEAPFERTIERTTLSEGREDIVNAAVGIKFTTGSGVTIVANSAWPLNRGGGLRPNVVWTAGLEYNF